ncbi:pentapeptide repeat-containing protein [Moorena sp. SIO4A5]|uniref:pentapeptide repeat-containing protein n=1 Tax=Moorena sp. SIO4A5 TaxID=2607838 RepID=UPI0025CC0AE7|nr:pentapeptide repeat-containing protein [Moorena sp. SIO4A5]
MAVIEILALTGNLTILIAVTVFIASEKDRRDSEIYQAWQVITAAYGQRGSGGRIQALEFLNSEPRRNPWFWLTWDRESLRGLEAPNAYLRGIILSNADLGGANLQEAILWEANLQKADLGGANLQKTILKEANLQEAFLWGANLQEAILWGANLQEVNLKGANLQKANLGGANLQEAFLWGANLQEAFLGGANLQKTNLKGAILKNAIYTDKNTLKATCKEFSKKYPCPTVFPENFNPKTVGMRLIK